VRSSRRQKRSAETDAPPTVNTALLKRTPGGTSLALDNLGDCGVGVGVCASATAFTLEVNESVSRHAVARRSRRGRRCDVPVHSHLVGASKHFRRDASNSHGRRRQRGAVQYGALCTQQQRVGRGPRTLRLSTNEWQSDGAKGRKVLNFPTQNFAWQPLRDNRRQIH
jgi:hypothetical protein